jgi:hypothetical protein
VAIFCTQVFEFWRVLLEETRRGNRFAQRLDGFEQKLRMACLGMGQRFSHPARRNTFLTLFIPYLSTGYDLLDT